MPQRDVAEWTREDYERAEREYQASLPPEHYMERIPHAKQREVTVASFALLRAKRPDVHLCNELLVQYPVNAHVGQVVPDNFVALSDEPLGDLGSFNVVFESARMFWSMEYVSPSNTRKDYEENYVKYEQELKVPYYLIFNPETKDLRLYQHDGITYAPVTPNADGRLAVPELNVEVAVLDGWARYWFEGELLPLPEELQAEIDAMKEQLAEARELAVQERHRAEKQQRRAEEERARAEDQQRRAEDQQRRAEEERARAEEERKGRAAAEAEVAMLRALLDRLQGGQPPASVGGV